MGFPGTGYAFGAAMASASCCALWARCEALRHCREGIRESLSLAVRRRPLLLMKVIQLHCCTAQGLDELPTDAGQHARGNLTAHGADDSCGLVPTCP